MGLKFNEWSFCSWSKLHFVSVSIILSEEYLQMILEDKIQIFGSRLSARLIMVRYQIKRDNVILNCTQNLHYSAHTTKYIQFNVYWPSWFKMSLCNSRTEKRSFEGLLNMFMLNKKIKFFKVIIKHKLISPSLIQKPMFWFFLYI